MMANSTSSGYQQLYAHFMASPDTLRVYKGDSLVFNSAKDGLLPLLEYVRTLAGNYNNVVVFDKIMGRAAALLCVKSSSRAVFSPLGSKLASEVFEQYGIEYHLEQVVPFITTADGKDMCPMEKLSLGKSPEEFYQAIIHHLTG